MILALLFVTIATMTSHALELYNEPEHDMPHSLFTNSLFPGADAAVPFYATSLHPNQTLSTSAHHPVIHAAFLAHQYNRRLTYEPDDVWGVVLAGLGHFVNLRPKSFFKHLDSDNKIDLVIFTKGDFVEDADQFAAKLKPIVADDEMHSAMIRPFSTSTPTHRMFAAISLMSTMKSYVRYMTLMCGIRSIEFLGTDEDWADVLNRTKLMIVKFGHDAQVRQWLTSAVQEMEWIPKARANTSEAVEHYKGWFRKQQVGSGGQYDYDGHVLKLFPPNVMYFAVPSAPVKRLELGGREMVYAAGHVGVEVSDSVHPFVAYAMYVPKKNELECDED